MLEGGVEKKRMKREGRGAYVHAWRASESLHGSLQLPVQLPSLNGIYGRLQLVHLLHQGIIVFATLSHLHTHLQICLLSEFAEKLHTEGLSHKAPFRMASTNMQAAEPKMHVEAAPRATIERPWGSRAGEEGGGGGSDLVYELYIFHWT